MKVSVRMVIGCEQNRNEPAQSWEKIIILPDRPLSGDYLMLDIGPLWKQLPISRVTWDERSSQYVVDAGVQWVTDSDYGDFIRAGLWTPIPLTEARAEIRKE